MGKRLKGLTGPAQDKKCGRCIDESIPPVMKTYVQEGETLEENYKNVMNLKEEYTERIERLITEATGTGSEGEEFDEKCLTRIIK